MSDSPRPADQQVPADEVESTAADDSQEVFGPSHSKSPWLWLVAGLIAAILVPMVVQASLSTFAVPLPAEYDQLSSLQDDASSQKANVLLTKNTLQNQRRFLVGPGVVMALVFGLFAGLISHRLTLGMVGAVIGAALAVVIGQVAADLTLDIETRVKGDPLTGDVSAMFMHAVTWSLFGIAAALAVLIGSARASMGFKTLGAAVLAASLSGVLYVILATIADPANMTSTSIPVEGAGRYLWTSLAPLLTGAFLSRTRRY